MEALSKNFPRLQEFLNENFNILPQFAEANVAIGVHIVLLFAFIWAIARNQSRPWSIFTWRQLTLLIMFVGAMSTSGYAHYVLFQPTFYQEMLEVPNDGSSGNTLAGSASPLQNIRTVRVSPQEVFYYVMTIMAVIITHSIMRPWIGSDEEAFGKKTDPWYKSLLVILGFGISMYYAWFDFQWQSNYKEEGRFEEVTPFLLPFLGYVTILFFLSVWITIDGILTYCNTPKAKKHAAPKLKTH